MLIVAASSILLYAASTINGFSYDDWALLVNNPSVHGLNLQNLKAIFTSVPNKMEFLPVRDFSYMLEHAFWGMRPAGYHITNILLYSAVCVMFYKFLSFLMREVFKSGDSFAFLGALLFVFHPAHAESVASISQRKDLLMGLFMLGSLYLFLKYRITGRRAHYAFSLALCGLSLMSKGTAVVLPALIFITDMFDGKGLKLKDKIYSVFPYAAIALLLTALNMYIFGREGVIKPAAYGLFWDKIKIAALAYALYAKKMIIPYPLSVWNEFDIFSKWTDTKVIASLSFLIAAFTGAAAMYRRRPLLSYLILWFSITIAPVLYIAQNNYLLFDRYLFMPSMSLSMVAAYIGHFAQLHLRGKLKMLSIGALALLLSVYGAMAYSQNRVWKNDKTVYSNAIKYSPGSASLYAMLGRALFMSGDYQRAFHALDAGRRLNPLMPDFDFYTAYLQYNNRDFAAAERTLKDLERRHGMGYIDSLMLLGMAYERLGDNNKAIQAYEKAAQGKISIHAHVFTSGDAKRSLERLRADGAD